MLGRKGYNTYVPLYTKSYGRGKTAELPLFSGYVFCQSEKDKLLPVLMTPGVFSVIGNGTEPLVVPEDEIDRVMKFVSSGLRTHPWPYIAVGQEVTVTLGPLKGISGLVVQAGSENWLLVSINLLQRSIAVRVDRDIVCDIRDRHLAVAASGSRSSQSISPGC